MTGLHLHYSHHCGDSALLGQVGRRAHESFEWNDGKLVIAANHGPIHLLQAAFYAVRLEVQRRGAVAVRC